MIDNHNTLDDLVRVATAYARKCSYGKCTATATRVAQDGWTRTIGLCDSCDRERSMNTPADLLAPSRELTEAPAIRRLVAAGVLV